MQKIFKYLMCATALAVGFTNCTKEIMDEGNNGNNSGKEGVSTYATFNFVINGASTKASDMINDSNEKNAINDIRLIIFKAGSTTTCEVNEAYDVNSTTPNPWDAAKSKTVQLTSGKKRIFVIANAEKQSGIKAGLDAITVGSTTISQFYGMVYDLGKTLGKMNELVSDANGYIMSNNISSKSSFELKGGIGLDESRGGTEQQNNFKVDIQRAVAKADVWYADASVLETTDKVGKLTDLKYAIRNVNRALYLFQKFSSDMVDPDVSIPNSPYYNLPTGTPVTTYDTIYYKDYKFVPVLNNKQSPKVYVTENTSEIQRNATTTYAAIETVFLPKKGMIIEDYKYNELTNSFHSIVTNSADATSGTTLYRLVNVGTSTGITANIFFKDKEKAYRVAYCIDKKTEAGFDINNISNLVWDESTGKGHIVEYIDGKCYYRLNLGEGNGNNFNPGLRRNYGYNAKITSFSGLGIPKLEDLDKDPDKPIGQKTHVTATINVVPWTNVDTEHQL
ncbi:MAG: Mfa1 family fimbria major subunit [Tannerellaceae bacterium]|jgi:hypothetical protein|nr:Mfa1 family fimbria major subunit [Tannerellaceae bacterium]